MDRLLGQLESGYERSGVLRRDDAEAYAGKEPAYIRKMASWGSEGGPHPDPLAASPMAVRGETGIGVGAAPSGVTTSTGGDTGPAVGGVNWQT